MDQPGSKRHSLVSFLRHAMLFSVGSALVLQERTAEFVEQAIEKGQEAQDEGKKMVQERRATKRSRRRGRLDVRIKDAAGQLGVPSRQDIDELDQHITALSERINELESNR